VKNLIETVVVAVAVLAAAVFIGRRVFAALRGAKPSCYTVNGAVTSAESSGGACSACGYCAGCSGCTVRKPDQPLQ